MTTVKELMASLYADSGMSKVAQGEGAVAEIAGTNLAAVGTEAGAAAVGAAAKALKAQKDQQIAATGGSAMADQVGSDPASEAAEIADRLQIAAGAQQAAVSNANPEEMLSTSQIASKVASMNEDELRSHVTALLTSLVGEEKVAADEQITEDDVKLAEEYDAAGRLMAEGFYSRLQEIAGQE